MASPHVWDFYNKFMFVKTLVGTRQWQPERLMGVNEGRQHPQNRNAWLGTNKLFEACRQHSYATIQYVRPNAQTDWHT